MNDKRRDKYRNIELVELIEKCQNDDRVALEELIRRHERLIYSTLYHLDPNRVDIADLAQEVLLRMSRSIKKLRNPKTFKYWLNQIITNLFYDELRRKTRRIKTVSMDITYADSSSEEMSQTREIPDKAQTPHEDTLGGELDKIIKKAIENLPEQFRIVVVLRELQGLSYEEIAGVTDTNIGTVKSRLARARTKLQENIKPYLK